MSGASGFAGFVSGLASSLRTTRVLYLECSNPDDLSGFSPDVNVSGITQNPDILEKIVERYPSFEFRQGDPSETRYEDGQFDFVFAHNLFNHLEGSEADRMHAEMYRVSSKYIANFEILAEDGRVFDGGGRRGMYSRWTDFSVRVISDVQMHEEIDPERCQFTLVRKI